MGQLQFANPFGITEINPWGKTIDAQRSDLWQVSFITAVSAIKACAGTAKTFSGLINIFEYEAQSVALPERRVKADPIRRDSRVYNMPGSDEPLDAIKMTFLLDSAASTSTSSNLLTILAAWRALVRAGRGAVSVEDGFTLNANYRIDYAFNVPVTLYQGGAVDGYGTKNDFDVSRVFVLQNCWLSGYKLLDLTYGDSKNVLVDATFYADDLTDYPSLSAMAGAMGGSSQTPGSLAY